MVDTYGAHECKAFYIVEESYGVLPANPMFVGINAEDIEPSLSPSLIQVRGLGSRDLLALKRGLRKPTLKITHILPSDAPIHFIQHASTLSSLSIPVYYYKGNFDIATNIIRLLYTGMRIDKLTVEGSVDDIVKASVELVGQSVSVGTTKISGAEYGEYSGAIGPENVTIKRGTGSGGSLIDLERVTDWKVTVENNLKAVPVVRSTSSHLLKYLQPRHRNLSGELTFEFEDKTEFDDIINDSEFSLQFLMGSNYLLFTYCKWDEVKTPTKIEDLVSLKARFTARGLTIS